MENPMVNYGKLIEETNSRHYNVADQYKDNVVEKNVEICKNDRLPFSVGVINITGELNVGMMIRSACLFGAEKFYIFGRKKYDKRSTVGAEKYIDIVQYTYDAPIDADGHIYLQMKLLGKPIVLCDHHPDAYVLGSRPDHPWCSDEPKMTHYDLNHPVFVFGSESHGIPEYILRDPTFWKVSIPQRGVLRSFNVSAAMNIVCWDYIKETQL